MSLRLEHPENALFPINFTDEGIFTVSRAPHPEKAQFPMLSTESGIVTDMILPQPEKGPSRRNPDAIFVTGIFSNSDGKMTSPSGSVSNPAKAALPSEIIYLNLPSLTLFKIIK